MPEQAGTDQSPGHHNPFIRADPLTRLLLDRLQLRPSLAGILVVLVVVLPVYVMATAGGLWQNQPGPAINAITGAVQERGRIGLSNDYGWWWYQLVSWPVTTVFLLWLPIGMCAAIEGLRRNGVLKAAQPQAGDGDALGEFTARFARSYSRPIWLLVSLVALAAYLFTGFIPYQREYHVWTTSGPLIFWYTQFVHAFMMYLMFLIAVRGAVMVVWFNRLFRHFEVDVNVLAPDRTGGFAPYGNLIVKAGYFIGIYGVTLVVLILEAPYRREFIPNLRLELTPEVLPLVVVYLLLAPVLFTLAVQTAHRAMKRARDRHLLPIAAQWWPKLESLEAALRSSDHGEFKQNAGELEQLKKMHQMVFESPVWPVDVRGIVRFFTAYLIPIALAVTITLIQNTVIKSFLDMMRK